MLQDATTSRSKLTLAELHALRASKGRDLGFFGETEVDYTNVKNLADAGRAELKYLERLLSSHLGPRGSRVPSIIGSSGSQATAIGSGSGSGMDSGLGSRIGSISSRTGSFGS